MSTKDTKVEEVIQDQTTPETDTPEVSNEEEKKEEKLLNQEQVNKLVQEIKVKEQKKADEAVLKAREEAERLATLSQDEKQKELDANRQKEVETREKELAVRENTLTAREKLRNAGISEDMAKFFVTPNMEETDERIDEFIEKNNDAVSKAVQERLKGSPPKDISSDSKTVDRNVPTTF